MRHFDLMPKVVGEFVDDHGLHEVRVALTRGVWRSAGDQTVPVQAAPAGALVHAVFQDRPSEGESCKIFFRPWRLYCLKRFPFFLSYGPKTFVNIIQAFFTGFWTSPTNGFGGFLSLEKNP